MSKISVTFTGELEDLLKFNELINAVKAAQLCSDSKVQSKEQSKVQSKVQSEEPVTLALMQRAVMEYAVRVHQKLKAQNYQPFPDIKFVCAEMINSVTNGAARLTKDVPDDMRKAVYDAAMADYIPEMFSK